MPETNGGEGGRKGTDYKCLFTNNGICKVRGEREKRATNHDLERGQIGQRRQEALCLREVSSDFDPYYTRAQCQRHLCEELLELLVGLVLAESEQLLQRGSELICL